MIKSLILVSALTSLVAALSWNIPVSFEKTLVLACNDKRKNILDFKNDHYDGVIESINIIDCAFPTDGFGVANLIKELGLTNVVKLTITSPKSPLKREHLSGLVLNSLQFAYMDVEEYPADLLEDVKVNKHLFFINGKLNKVPRDLLKSVPDIKSLIISFNKLTKINLDDFASSTNLNELLLHGNGIEEIEEGAFDGIENLQSLDLSDNNLKSLPETFFHKMKNLLHIRISANKLTELPVNLLTENSKLKSFRVSDTPGIVSVPGGIFKGLRNLEFVELIANGLVSLPGDLFSNLPVLNMVYLGLNNIAELPAGIFDDATELKKLYLERNRLTSLPENIFSKNKLEELHLYGNMFTNITEGYLKGLDKLKVLSVARNSLSHISRNLCDYLKSLEEIDVSENQLDLLHEEFSNDESKSISIFKQCEHLRKINAAHNKVSYVFEDFHLLPNLTDINLSNNRIEKLSVSDIVSPSKVNIDLSNNKISLFNFKNLEDVVGNCSEESNTIDIAGNPVHCDCDLVRYFEHGMSSNVYKCVKIINSYKCASPPELANRYIDELTTYDLSCPGATINPNRVESIRQKIQRLLMNQTSTQN